MKKGRWREFKKSRTNVHDEERSGQPTVHTDELVQEVDQKLECHRGLTISALHYEFPLIRQNIIFKIVKENGHKLLLGGWHYRLNGVDLSLHTVIEDGHVNILRHPRNQTIVNPVTPFKPHATTKKNQEVSFRDWENDGYRFFGFITTTVKAAIYCETLTKLRRTI